MNQDCSPQITTLHITSLFTLNLHLNSLVAER